MKQNRINNSISLILKRETSERLSTLNFFLSTDVFTLCSKWKSKDIFVLEIYKNLDSYKITETFF